MAVNIHYKVYYYIPNGESFRDVACESVDGEDNLKQFMNLLITKKCLIQKIVVTDITMRA